MTHLDEETHTDHAYDADRVYKVYCWMAAMLMVGTACLLLIACIK